MAIDTEMLEAMRAMMKEELKPINSRLDTMQADIDQIKEDTAITRETTNMLGEWTEIASDVLKIKYPVSQ